MSNTLHTLLYYKIVTSVVNMFNSDRPSIMRTLRLTCWNVNGLFRRSHNYCKLEDKEFIDSITGYDIIGLVETHVGPEDTVSLANYHTYQFNRPKVSKAQKYSGGIAILVKNDIKNAVSLVSSGLFSIWLKLDKNFFHFDNDIFVCVTYLPRITRPTLITVT